MTTLLTLALAITAAVAAWSDLSTRRIPNVLTVGALVLALLLRASLGWAALFSGFAGAGIAFALIFPLFALGGFGGGDAKLLMAMGAFLGLEGLLAGLVSIGLIGSTMAAAEAMRRSALPLTVPYGVAIGAGAVIGRLLAVVP